MSSPNSASLTPKPLASSVYVHVLEAPSPLKRSILVMSPFPSAGSPYVAQMLEKTIRETPTARMTSIRESVPTTLLW